MPAVHPAACVATSSGHRLGGMPPHKAGKAPTIKSARQIALRWRSVTVSKEVLRISCRQIPLCGVHRPMAVYQLVDQLSRDPESRERWFIERSVPGGAPIRLLFQGTRRQAQSEVTRLNAFLKSKTGGSGPRAAENRGFRTQVDSLTLSAWSMSGFGLSGSVD